eukprot:ANDGO_05362.mRNA.1 hypothetical protein NAEGRDRAFT_62107
MSASRPAPLTPASQQSQSSFSASASLSPSVAAKSSSASSRQSSCASDDSIVIPHVPATQLPYVNVLKLCSAPSTGASAQSSPSNASPLFVSSQGDVTSGIDSTIGKRVTVLQGAIPANNAIALPGVSTASLGIKARCVHLQICPIDPASSAVTPSSANLNASVVSKKNKAPSTPGSSTLDDSTNVVTTGTVAQPMQPARQVKMMSFSIDVLCDAGALSVRMSFSNATRSAKVVSAFALQFPLVLPSPQPRWTLVTVDVASLLHMYFPNRVFFEIRRVECYANMKLRAIWAAPFPHSLRTQPREFLLPVRGGTAAEDVLECYGQVFVPEELEATATALSTQPIELDVSANENVQRLPHSHVQQQQQQQIIVGGVSATTMTPAQRTKWAKDNTPATLPRRSAAQKASAAANQRSVLKAKNDQFMSMGVSRILDFTPRTSLMLGDNRMVHASHSRLVFSTVPDAVVMSVLPSFLSAPVRGIVSPPVDLSKIIVYSKNQFAILELNRQSLLGESSSQDDSSVSPVRVANAVSDSLIKPLFIAPLSEWLDIRSIAISQDESTIAILGRDSLRRWRVVLLSWPSLRPIVGHVLQDATSFSVAFHPNDSSRVVVLSPSSVRILRIVDRSNSVRAAAVQLPHPYTFAGSNHVSNGSVPLGVDAEVFSTTSNAGDAPELTCMAIVENNSQMLVGTSLGDVLVISLENRTVDRIYRLHSSRIASVAVAEGMCVTGDMSGLVRLWPLDFSDFFLEAAHDAPVVHISIAPSGFRVLVGTFPVPQNAPPAGTAAGPADGSSETLRSEKPVHATIGVLDIPTQTYSSVLLSHPRTIRVLAVADYLHGALVTASEDGAVRIWDTGSEGSMRPRVQFDVPTGQWQQEVPTALVATLDNRLVVGYSSGILRVVLIDHTVSSSSSSSSSGGGIVVEREMQIAPVGVAIDQILIDNSRWIVVVIKGECIVLDARHGWLTIKKLSIATATGGHAGSDMLEAGAVSVREGTLVANTGSSGWHIWTDILASRRSHIIHFPIIAQSPVHPPHAPSKNQRPVSAPSGRQTGNTKEELDKLRIENAVPFVLRRDLVLVIARQNLGLLALSPTGIDWQFCEPVPGKTWFDVESPVSSIALSRDGRVLVVGTNSGAAHLFTVSALDASLVFVSACDVYRPQVAVSNLALSKDGRHIYASPAASGDEDSGRRAREDRSSALQHSSSRPSSAAGHAKGSMAASTSSSHMSVASDSIRSVTTAQKKLTEKVLALSFFRIAAYSSGITELVWGPASSPNMFLAEWTTRQGMMNEDADRSQIVDTILRLEDEDPAELLRKEAVSLGLQQSPSNSDWVSRDIRQPDSSEDCEFEFPNAPQNVLLPADPSDAALSLGIWSASAAQQSHVMHVSKQMQIMVRAHGRMLLLEHLSSGRRQVVIPFPTLGIVKSAYVEHGILAAADSASCSLWQVQYNESTDASGVVVGDFAVDRIGDCIIGAEDRIAKVVVVDSSTVMVQTPSGVRFMSTDPSQVQHCSSAVELAERVITAHCVPSMGIVALACSDVVVVANLLSGVIIGSIDVPHVCAFDVDPQQPGHLVLGLTAGSTGCSMVNIDLQDMLVLSETPVLPSNASSVKNKILAYPYIAVGAKVWSVLLSSSAGVSARPVLSFPLPVAAMHPPFFSLTDGSLYSEHRCIVTSPLTLQGHVLRSNPKGDLVAVQESDTCVSVWDARRLDLVVRFTTGSDAQAVSAFIGEIIIAGKEELADFSVVSVEWLSNSRLRLRGVQQRSVIVSLEKEDRITVVDFHKFVHFKLGTPVPDDVEEKDPVLVQSDGRISVTIRGIFWDSKPIKLLSCSTVAPQTVRSVSCSSPLSAVRHEPCRFDLSVVVCYDGSAHVVIAAPLDAASKKSAVEYQPKVLSLPGALGKIEQATVVLPRGFSEPRLLLKTQEMIVCFGVTAKTLDLVREWVLPVDHDIIVSCMSAFDNSLLVLGLEDGRIRVVDVDSGAAQDSWVHQSPVLGIVGFEQQAGAHEFVVVSMAKNELARWYWNIPFSPQ